MSAEHTQGAWCVSPFTAHVLSQDFGRDGELLPVAAMLWPTDERSEAETYANARLIAAAPQMLAALSELLGDEPANDESGLCRHCGRDNSDNLSDPCSEDCPGEIARGAIARATGAA